MHNTSASKVVLQGNQCCDHDDCTIVISCKLSVLLSGNVRIERYVQTYILLGMVGNVIFSHARSLLTTPLTVSDNISM